jgi:hypothetical protein
MLIGGSLARWHTPHMDESMFGEHERLFDLAIMSYISRRMTKTMMTLMV